MNGRSTASLENMNAIRIHLTYKQSATAHSDASWTEDSELGCPRLNGNANIGIAGRCVVRILDNRETGLPDNFDGHRSRQCSLIPNDAIVLGIGDPKRTRTELYIAREVKAVCTNDKRAASIRFRARQIWLAKYLVRRFAVGDRAQVFPVQHAVIQSIRDKQMMSIA